MVYINSNFLSRHVSACQISLERVILCFARESISCTSETTA